MPMIYWSDSQHSQTYETFLIVYGKYFFEIDAIRNEVSSVQTRSTL